MDGNFQFLACVHTFHSETPCPSNNPRENSHKWFMSSEAGNHDNPSLKNPEYVWQDSALENIIKKQKCGITHMSSGAILLKKGCIH
jgi:hypothetical protein